jgi:phosphate starvation-inducible protein PhoH and related proteins
MSGTDMSDKATIRHAIGSVEKAREISGEHGANLRVLGREARVSVDHRGNTLTISGRAPAVDLALRVVQQLEELLDDGTQREITPAEIAHGVRLCRGDASRHLRDFLGDVVLVNARRRPITPRSPAQKVYVDAIRRRDAVFGIGPAGTGKTFLAMAMAVAAHQRGDVVRIVLTRPAVEAGEKLGFLPGDLQEKVNPYLRPLNDALNDMMDFNKARRMLERGTIEVAPLAFMRGRTLNDSFVILDEAQNTTSEQMKMFLTRLGIGSQAVITGDVTQIDLPPETPSGLVEASRLLTHIDGIDFVRFTEQDVVRHTLVQEIIRAYDGASGHRNSRGRRRN